MRELNPKEDVVVNRYELDEACEMQSHLAYCYGEKYIEAIEQAELISEQVEKFKEDLKEIQAFLILKIKSEFLKYDFDKQPSDKMAESWAIIQPEYKEVQSKYREAREKAIKVKKKEGLYKIYYYAIGDKKDSTEKLIKLYLNGYYSEPDTGNTKPKNKENYEEVKSLESATEFKELMNRRKRNG